MADQNDSLANEPRSEATSLTRRSRVRRPVRKTKAVATTAPATRPAASAPKRAAKQVRNLFVLSLVGGLVATAAMPAFAGVLQKDEPVTLQQMAVDDAQSVVVASDAVGTQLSRESYSATTSDEIAKKKAAEAAAERARQSAQVATSLNYNIDLNMVAPGSGAVRWPVTNFTLTDTFGTRGGAHRGIDLVAPAGTPIYAAAAGVVKVSSEAYYDYGVAITIDHVINGTVVNTLYAHQSYGCRQVVAGQTVQAGQVIGCVGSTGRSTANHLHFEVYMNGGNVDPLAWLNANAG